MRAWRSLPSRRGVVAGISQTRNESTTKETLSATSNAGIEFWVNTWRRRFGIGVGDLDRNRGAVDLAPIFPAWRRVRDGTSKRLIMAVLKVVKFKSVNVEAIQFVEPEIWLGAIVRIGVSQEAVAGEAFPIR